jgi:hypothetical protein
MYDFMFWLCAAAKARSILKNTLCSVVFFSAAKAVRKNTKILYVVTFLHLGCKAASGKKKLYIESKNTHREKITLCRVKKYAGMRGGEGPLQLGDDSSRRLPLNGEKAR